MFLAVVVPAESITEVQSDVQSDVQLPVNDPYDLTTPQVQIDFSVTQPPTASARLTAALRGHVGPMDRAGINALQAIIVDENPVLQDALNEDFNTPPPSPPTVDPVVVAPGK